MPAGLKQLVIPFDPNSGISPVDVHLRFMQSANLDGIYPELIKVTPEDGDVGPNSVTAHYYVMDEEAVAARAIAHLLPGSATYKKPYSIMPDPQLVLDLASAEGLGIPSDAFPAYAGSGFMNVKGKACPLTNFWAGVEVGDLIVNPAGTNVYQDRNVNQSPSINVGFALLLEIFPALSSMPIGAQWDVIAANSMTWKPEGGDEVTLTHGAISIKNSSSNAAFVTSGSFYYRMWVDDRGNVYLGNRYISAASSGIKWNYASTPTRTFEEATQFGVMGTQLIEALDA